MAAVVECTLSVRPGHYAEVLYMCLEFDQTYIDINPAFVSQLVVGDEGARIVHGIVLYADHAEAAAASSEAFFSDFKDVVEPLIEGAPTRFPLDLAHAWSK